MEIQQKKLFGLIVIGDGLAGFEFVAVSAIIGMAFW